MKRARSPTEGEVKTIEQIQIEKKQRKDDRKAMNAAKTLLRLESPQVVNEAKAKKRRKVSEGRIIEKTMILEEEMDGIAMDSTEAPEQVKQPIASTSTSASTSAKPKKRASKKVVPKVKDSIPEADDDEIVIPVASKSKSKKTVADKSTKGKGKEIIEEVIEIPEKVKKVTKRVPKKSKKSQESATEEVSTEEVVEIPEKVKKVTKSVPKKSRNSQESATQSTSQAKASLIDDSNNSQVDDESDDDDEAEAVEKALVDKKVKKVVKKVVKEVKAKEKGKKVDLEESENSASSEILATKWFSSSQLKEFEQEQGITIKRGKFSFTETELMKEAVEQFRVNNGLTKGELIEIITSKKNEKKNEGNEDRAVTFQSFYSSIAKSVESRPLSAIYVYIKRTYDPKSNLGPWTSAEDALLKAAQKEHGNKWTLISTLVGRSADTCKDRFRNNVVGSEVRVTGAWSEEEEDKLRDIMDKSESWTGGKANWTGIAEALGGGRTRHQIRIKWTDSLQKKLPGDKAGIHSWTKGHSARLASFIKSQRVNDHSEIDWKLACKDSKLAKFGPNNLLVWWKRILAEASLAIGDDKFSNYLKWALEHYDDKNDSLSATSRTIKEATADGIKAPKKVLRKVKLDTSGKSAAIIDDSGDESDE